MNRTVLHCDLNNFYASVECRENPTLKDKPVAVCGSIKERHGIVLAKNYIAKEFGIITGEPVIHALKKCPSLVILPPDMQKYEEASAHVRRICMDYTSQIEPYGMDECWMDVTGSRLLFGDGEKIANEIRARIYKEVGITASVGVSFNKIFAKLASDLKKPDATTLIPQAYFKKIVNPLPANMLFFVGNSTSRILHRAGINTIGDLAASSPKALKYLLGKTGEILWCYANGLDETPVCDQNYEREIKSIGNGATALHDLNTDESAKRLIYMLSEKVATRLRQNAMRCSLLRLHIRSFDLHAVSHQRAMPIPSQSAGEIGSEAFSLFKHMWQFPYSPPIRSITVQACSLKDELTGSQLSMLDEFAAHQKRDTLEQAIDKIRGKYGYGSIMRASVMLGCEHEFLPSSIGV
ncbi:MAG TPA: DNA polymerase IV [Clostridia bacterium]|nr:DNA polymerase IV [Clostridia bacterium]